MASDKNSGQIRLIKDLIREAIEEKYSILLERPGRSNLINEGVFDEGILKVVFTAGGPGSGKSFLADLIFGVRDAAGKPYFKNASFLGRTGLKYVNSDKFFEKQLKDNDIDAGDLQRIEKEEPELWDKIQGASPDSLRNIAKGKLKMLKGFFESGRIGMLVDGTGGKYDKMVRQKETAEALGYDTMLLFVDTSEEIAVERNANRERKLPEEKVRQLWSDVQNNKKGFENLFGDKMVIVNNDKFGPPPEEVVEELNKFVSAPVQNPIGQVWIEDELEMRGVQTLEPGGAGGFRGSKQAADRIQQMRDIRGEVD